MLGQCVCVVRGSGRMGETGVLFWCWGIQREMGENQENKYQDILIRSSDSRGRKIYIYVCVSMGKPHA